MKTKIVATALAMFTAFSAVSCKVADKNQNIKSSAGGGYFYITRDQYGDRYINVCNNSQIGNCRAYVISAHGAIYEFSWGGTEYTLGKTNDGWELE